MQQKIRNFCIIAHIDHGKSTLADRFLEMTGTVDKRHLIEQTLDSMELEKEKGITIKLKPVRMSYEYKNEIYQLNLIDTPGHVDFAYEVSRSLAACEGAILIVDATQGIQAQTISNIYKALDANLHIIPVLNKIDMQNAEVEKVTQAMIKNFGFKKEEIMCVSAKTGIGVKELLDRVVKEIPEPKGATQAPLRALIFDTFYDEFLGVVAALRIMDGKIDESVVKSRKKIRFTATHAESTPEQIGIFKPGRLPIEALYTGEVGYIATGMKDIHKVKVGDTLILAADAAQTHALPGYKEVKPFVFVSIYPLDNAKFPELREALQKLSLSDSSLRFEPESSNALGFGFRCGFLGLLHADIVQERLEREYNLELISTTPTVEYEILKTDGNVVFVKSSTDFPEVTQIEQIKEPWIKATIVAPSDYTGSIITLCEDRRGILLKLDYPSEDRVIFEYELPLIELVFNFFDELKNISSGFASLDYEFCSYKEVDAIKMDIIVHGELVAPLSQIVLKSKAAEYGKKVVRKLKDVIPRQQFKVAIQAAVGGKILAREDIPAFRKNVLAKMSGGHRERKDKLLEKQKKGKERMKSIGKIVIPQEAFREVLKK